MQPWALRSYVALISSLGAFVVVRSLLQAPEVELRTVLLAALAVMCSVRSVQLPGTGVRLNADTPFLLALVDAGSGGVAVLAAAAGHALATVASGSASRAPFNVGAGAASIAFAAVVAEAFSGALAPLPVLCAGLGAFAAS